MIEVNIMRRNSASGRRRSSESLRSVFNVVSRSPTRRSAVAAVALVVIGSACDSPVTPRAAPAVTDAEVIDAPSPLVRVLDVSLEHSAGATVEYWSADGPRLRVVTDSVGPRHELVLSRLRPETTYEFAVQSSGPLGVGAPATGSFTTAALPAGLAILDFQAEGMPTEPLTVFEIARHEGGFAGIVIVDQDGEVVWYLDSGRVQGTALRSNGNLAVVVPGSGIIEVTATGEVVAELPTEPAPGRRPHHDVITTPSNTLLFIAHDTRDFEGRSIVGEAIWEWDPGTGALDRRWSSWDQLSPALDWGSASRDDDWLHANAIAIGPAGNVLMSLRFLNQVISISPDFSGIEWRLGGVNADVQVEGDDIFVGQHTAAELSPSGGRRRVLLFDNGPIGRGFSRAQELELDLEAGTATTVWEYRPTPDNFSFITSLARRLPNGNTFVAFGAGPDVLSSFGPVEAFEVDPSGDVQFHIEVAGATVDDSFILYRAWPLSSVGDEQIVP